MRMMARPQLRPIYTTLNQSSPIEGPVTLARQFSVSQRQAYQPSGHYGSAADSRSSASASSRPLFRKLNLQSANANNTGTNGSNSDRPQRVVDARSLAASQAGGQQANILRSPRLRSIRGGIQARAARRPGAPQTAVAWKANPRGRKEGLARPAKRQSEAEEGDDSRAVEIEKAHLEQAKKEKQRPTPYAPQTYDLSTLQQTWPSLPTDVPARANSVFEKLSWLSERYPNGYVPPYELGKRLFEGKNVFFLNDEEKFQAVKEAKKLARQRADRLTQRKGDLVEPKNTSFNSIGAEEKETLFRSVVQGKYPDLEPQQADKSPILVDVLRNLRNNQTYITARKSSQFVSKLESLLASSRPVKTT